jgi:hypothetical protein
VNVDKYRATANKLIRNPDDPVALVDQFALISEKRENGRLYLPLAKRAYELAPHEISSIFNYASALHRAGEFNKALTLYIRSLDFADDEWRPKCLHHVGIAYRALGENKKAADYYQKAYDLCGDPTILRDRALAILANGDLIAGFKAFEVRKEAAQFKLANNGGELITQARLPDDAVHWQGENLKGKTVVVYHEEGSGDFIQFCRFIPRLREQAPEKIYLTGQVPNLLDLVADQIPVDGIVPLAGPFDADYVVGSMSIPWRVGIDFSQVSGKPYFHVEAAKIPVRGRINVGLVWRGNPAYGMDVHRSMSFSEFCPLFDIPGIAFHSFQCGPAGLEVTNLGFDGFVANMEPLCKTWRDTARLIQAMDLVVSVDTAVAHLAGALGKPVMTLVTNASDWRWDRFSERTRWYDSMRVIRQKKQDDWKPCINRVREKLVEMTHVRRSAA